MGLWSLIKFCITFPYRTSIRLIFSAFSLIFFFARLTWTIAAMGPLFTYMTYVSLSTLIVAASYNKSIAQGLKNLPDNRAGFVIGITTSIALELPIHSIIIKVIIIQLAKLFGALSYWLGYLFLLIDVLNILVLYYFYAENIMSVQAILKQLPEVNSQNPKFAFGSLVSRTLTPTYHSTHNLTIFKSVSYYTPEDQLDASVSSLLLNQEGLMDIYATSQDPSTAPKKPIVMYIHGGAWILGSKEDHYPIVQTLADQGFLVISINYRLAGVQKMPAGFHDVQKAINWTKKNISEYGGDSNFIVLAGDSAGAHLSLLAALTGAKHDSARVQGVISLSGGLDVTDKYKLDAGRKKFWLEQICGNDESVSEEYAPVTHLLSGGIQVPPMLAFHATDDILSPVQEARNVGQRWKELGGSHTLVEVPAAQHAFCLYNSPRTLTMGEAAAEWAMNRYTDSKKQ